MPPSQEAGGEYSITYEIRMPLGPVLILKNYQIQSEIISESVCKNVIHSD
jgi:hypothetical protein